MRDSNKKGVLNSDDYGTTLFRGRKTKLYFEDLDQGYYKEIVKKILGYKYEDVDVLTPQYKFEFVNGELIAKDDEGNNGKAGVLKLHDEAIKYKSKNLYFVVDADHDIITNNVLKKHLESSQLHILNVYSIENYHVSEGMARELINPKMNKQDDENYPKRENFLKYKTWKNNIVNCFRVLLPLLLAIHDYNEKDGKNQGILKCKSAKLDIKKLFNLSNEKVSLKTENVKGEYWHLKTNLIYIGYRKKYTDLVQRFPDDKIFDLIPGKILLRLFTYYLFDISTCLSGQKKCEMNCGECSETLIQKCKKIMYRGNEGNFRLDTHEKIDLNPKFEELKHFIVSSI